MTADTFEDLPVIQRRVAAGATPMSKPAGAVRSIFEAGKAAKPVRGKSIPLPEDVKIKAGVPIPVAIRDKCRRDFFGELIQRMGDGDMVELEPPHSRSLRSRAKKLGIDVTLRVLENGKIGVWRVGLFASKSTA
jgi:hypothetical protein